jgi:excisionase family DNA binding protein
MDRPVRILYQLEEAAELLGVGRSTIYELVKRGELDLVKIGRRSLVSAEQLGANVAKITARPEQQA